MTDYAFAGQWSVVAKKSQPKFNAEEFLAHAGGGRIVANYTKGQVIFAQGGPADSVFFIQEGRVKISVLSEQGKEAVVAFLKAGDFIGEGLSDRAGSARFNRQGRTGLRHYAPGQANHGTDAPRRTGVLRTVHRASFGAHDPRGGGPGRPAVNSSEKRLARAMARCAILHKACARI